MDEPAAEGKSPEKRGGPSTRSIVLWGAGMLAVLGLVWFVAAWVVPVWRVRVVMVRAANMNTEPGEYVIESLGDGPSAARRLGLYLRVPAPFVPHRRLAAGILGQCGHYAESELPRLLADRDPEVRAEAVDALGRFREARFTEPLMAALRDSDSNVRRLAARALGEIGVGATQAVSALAGLLEDEDKPVRQAAAEALKKIKAAQAKQEQK